MTSHTAWNAICKTASAESCPPPCPICLDSLTITTSDTSSTAEHAVTITGCGHVFGYTCLTTWMREQNTCPVYRVEFFTVPQPVIESHAGSGGPQHYVLSVYTFDSSVEVAINSVAQSLRRLEVDPEQESQNDKDESEQPRRGEWSSGGGRHFLR